MDISWSAFKISSGIQYIRYLPSQTTFASEDQTSLWFTHPNWHEVNGSDFIMQIKMMNNSPLSIEFGNTTSSNRFPGVRHDNQTNLSNTVHCQLLRFIKMYSFFENITWKRFQFFRSFSIASHWAFTLKYNLLASEI